MAKNDKTQLRISETEKYAHVTFFFNGGVEEPFKGEDRILINSPKVATYDLQPEMSSAELTENWLLLSRAVSTTPSSVTIRTAIWSVIPASWKRQLKPLKRWTTASIRLPKR